MGISTLHVMILNSSLDKVWFARYHTAQANGDLTELGKIELKTNSYYDYVGTDTLTICSMKYGKKTWLLFKNDTNNSIVYATDVTYYSYKQGVKVTQDKPFSILLGILYRPDECVLWIVADPDFVLRGVPRLYEGMNEILAGIAMKEMLTND